MNLNNGDSVGKMTQNFNEWLKENPNKSYADIYEYGSSSFEAGAQSKQAEIDEYKMVAESMEDVYLREKSKVDELRKRIDEALNMLCKLQYSSGERIYNDVGNILKGTTNEQ